MAVTMISLALASKKIEAFSEDFALTNSFSEFFGMPSVRGLLYPVALHRTAMRSQVFFVNQSFHHLSVDCPCID